MSVQQAADALGVPRRRIWQLIKQGMIPTEPNPLDRRSKLISASEIERLSHLPRAPKRQGVAVGEKEERDGPGQQGTSGSTGQNRPKPRTFDLYTGPVRVHSDELEDYMREHWKPQ
jgi:hypothetical protein